MMIHGSPAYSRLHSVPSSNYAVPGRYGRMFSLPSFAPYTDKFRDALMLLGRPGGILDAAGFPDADLINPTLPAGFTYLGQFIDHDITFDASSSMQRQRDPDTLGDYRTPALDLDSLYGGGPIVSPHLYCSKPSQQAHFLTESLDDSKNPYEMDLPRNSEGLALIADPRNDENAVLSQLTLAFMRFHNAVVDDYTHIPRYIASPLERFDRAQKLVRWHYQWIVLHQYLRRLVGNETWRRVLGVGQQVTGRQYFQWLSEPFIPVEFSVAAFRFGHSQVRNDYHLNDWPFDGVNGPYRQVHLFDPQADFTRPLARKDLSGRKRVPHRVVEWDRFFDLRISNVEIQMSRKIDRFLAPGLLNMPRKLLPTDRTLTSLAHRTFLRHLALEIPSGQDIARRMYNSIKDMPTLDRNAFRLFFPRDENPVHLYLRDSTPLWLYILYEAEQLGKADMATGGRQRRHGRRRRMAVLDDQQPAREDGDQRTNQRLGPVGGRIVAEVIVGLLEGDRTSFLCQNPDWRPCLGHDGRFGIEDLLRIAKAPTSLDGKAVPAVSPTH
jgi:hypothetical protein